jgi:multiple sugar transport system permease protein
MAASLLPPRAATSRTGRSSGARARRRLALGLLFASPWLIGFVAFTLYPILASFYVSLTENDLLTPPRWIGLQNYSQLVHDTMFQTALGNTLWLVLIRMPVVLIVGFTLALLLNSRLKGMGFFRIALYLPNFLPPVAAAVFGSSSSTRAMGF